MNGYKNVVLKSTEFSIASSLSLHNRFPDTHLKLPILTFSKFELDILPSCGHFSETYRHKTSLRIYW